MARKDTAALLRELVSPVVEGVGLELYDVEFVKEGPNWYVRIFIDKPGGVTIDDCEMVSRKAEAVLDEKDPIEQSYILEVSSPGIDRELKKDADFERYRGTLVDIKLYKARDGDKVFQGKLIGLVDGIISIDDEKKGVLTFGRAEVASCRLAVIF